MNTNCEYTFKTCWTWDKRVGHRDEASVQILSRRRRGQELETEELHDTTSVENRRNHYLQRERERELAIVLFDGCIVELRAFVMGERNNALPPLSLSSNFFFPPTRTQIFLPLASSIYNPSARIALTVASQMKALFRRIDKINRVPRTIVEWFRNNARLLHARPTHE